MKVNDCPFCQNNREKIAENSTCFAMYDGYPVSKGHTLIIPNRHIETYFDLTNIERDMIFDLLAECKKRLDLKYKPDGYNIGINCGEAAGQTVNHLHVHLIPRYKGDMENPRGGVRGVIPERRLY